MHVSITVQKACNSSLCSGHGNCTKFNPGELSEMYECICDPFYTGQSCEHYLSYSSETMAVAGIMVFAFLYYLMFCSGSSCCGNHKVNPPRVRARFVDYINNKNAMEKRMMKDYYKQKMGKLPEKAKEVLNQVAKDDELTICLNVPPPPLPEEAAKDEKEKKKEKKKEKGKEEQKEDKKKSVKSVKSVKKQKSLIGAATSKEIKKATAPGEKISNEAQLEKQKEEVSRLTEKVNSKLVKPMQTALPLSKEGVKEQPERNDNLSSIGMPDDCPADKKEFEEKTKKMNEEAGKERKKKSKSGKVAKPKA